MNLIGGITTGCISFLKTYWHLCINEPTNQRSMTSKEMMRSQMSEPMYLQGDDVALGINQPCDDCDELDCTCGQPDRMWGDEE